MNREPAGRSGAAAPGHLGQFIDDAIALSAAHGLVPSAFSSWDVNLPRPVRVLVPVELDVLMVRQPGGTWADCKMAPPPATSDGPLGCGTPRVAAPTPAPNRMITAPAFAAPSMCGPQVTVLPLTLIDGSPASFFAK